MSHVKKILQHKPDVIFLVMGMDKTIPCYHYFLVDPLKRTAFMESCRQGRTDLSLYGTVIESGYGQPGREVRERMKKDYGFEPECD